MIIVDPLFVSRAYHGAQKAQAAAVGSRHGDQWCHMASTVDNDELDMFAVSIGLKVYWRDDDHYDLTPGKRKLAVNHGAQEVTALELSYTLNYDRKGRERPKRDHVDELDELSLRSDNLQPRML